jgi:hypothetical protein
MPAAMQAVDRKGSGFPELFCACALKYATAKPSSIKINGTYSQCPLMV